MFSARQCPLTEVTMSYTLLGHVVEAIGFILISIPLITMIITYREIGSIEKIYGVPDEIKIVLTRAERINAIFPERSELICMLIGFIFNFCGIAILIINELFSR
jgi:hypothetical protein